MFFYSNHQDPGSGTILIPCLLLRDILAQELEAAWNYSTLGCPGYENIKIRKRSPDDLFRITGV